MFILVSQIPIGGGERASVQQISERDGAEAARAIAQKQAPAVNLLELSKRHVYSRVTNSDRRRRARFRSADFRARWRRGRPRNRAETGAGCEFAGTLETSCLFSCHKFRSEAASALPFSRFPSAMAPRPPAQSRRNRRRL